MADENVNDTSRRSNPGNMPQPGDDNQKKKPKFNIYWVYGILFIALIGWNLVRGVAGLGRETSETAFYEMVKRGHVEKTKTVLNKSIVRVFLYKDSITNNPELYKRLLDLKDQSQFDQLLKVAPPQVSFGISKDKTITELMNANNFYEKNPGVKVVPDYPEDEGEFISQLVTTLLPILLIGLLFIMMMRKVGGPGGAGGGPGGIFNKKKPKFNIYWVYGILFIALS